MIRFPRSALDATRDESGNYATTRAVGSGRTVA